MEKPSNSQGLLDGLMAAVARDPDSPQAHYHLADAQLACGRIADASEHAARAVRLGARGPSARELWAAALAAAGELHAALVVLRAADSPVRPPGQYLRVLGKRLARAGILDEALRCLRRSLDHNPDDREAAHLIAALDNQNPAHPDPEYVRRHFDDFAASFDHQLVDVLGYAGPREIKTAVLAAHTLDPPWRVLDLGCGTGLVALELAEHGARIDGIDLSSRMIEHARQRGLYADLSCNELLPALEGIPAASYDLVTAADVFIYVGRLDNLIAAVRRVLRPSGMLAFTAEAAQRTPAGHGAGSTGYWLERTGRYSHSAAYLDALAHANGFGIQMHRPIVLRQESARPVHAWVVLWTAVPQNSV